MTAKDRINGPVGFSLPPDEIVCRTCRWRFPDLMSGDRVVVAGYKNGYCDIYTKAETGGKPGDILFHHGRCEFHEEEE